MTRDLADSARRCPASAPAGIALSSGGRHDVVGTAGVSSSSHAIGSGAGAEMLIAGGNAVDAAVATGFALAVAEPAMSHLGGQGNMLVAMADEPSTVAIDFYACAPSAARPGMFEWIESPTQGGYRFHTVDDRNTTGGASVCIPGTVSGWLTAHERWGTLPLSRVVAPAVRAARDGVALTPRIADYVRDSQERLCQFPDTAAVFLHDDLSPRGAGEVILQPQLADTIEAIAMGGIEAFYDGPIAEDIVAAVAETNGVLSRDDLADYPTSRQWVREPDRIDFHGHVVEGATPSANALLLHLLGLLDGHDFHGLDPLGVDQVHHLIESMKLAFADRVHMGDHTQVDLPLQGLLSAGYLDTRRRLVDAAHAGAPGPGDPWTHQAGTRPAGASRVGGDFCTTHHSHVDQWGNMVSMTQSLGDLFGSAVTVPGRGILLNNAMKLFDPRPGAGNAGIAAHRRPLSPWPTIVRSAGPAVLAIGSPSGTRIPNALAQVLTNVICHGDSLSEAIARPRVHWSGDELEVEADLPTATLDGLRARGHAPIVRSAQSPWFGAVQAVGHNRRRGLFHGAADARRDGCAVAVGGAPSSPPVPANPGMTRATT